MTKLETYGREALNTVLERIGRGVSQVQSRKPLSYDLLESDTEYLIVFDAPGATAEDVQVQFVNGDVEVRIDRFRAFHKGFEMRFPGRGLTLSGTAELPDAASVTGSDTTPDATLTQDGTLHVTIPKAETAHTVAVEDDDADAEHSGDEQSGDDTGDDTEDDEQSDDDAADTHTDDT
ncbi:Hsp20/alpha crystallin family protein [Halonotius roseus]|uniref:Hsp20/alpha crystallin family protein n=1 Tax=Halonotius roseus TaxID=2511997 RepID=A0A544QLJ4_9EURY|nr:Hsp20 family protein [Halonotius roseus]TQQ79467.1 Hsp20/alpha crystallin family protein [Halonotius roseus]